METKKSILDLIKSRRSCRKFKQDSVPDEDIMGVLEAAKWAPSGGNSQPWKFIIIKNKETMEKIVELIPYREFQNFLRLAPVLIVVLGNSKKMWHIIDGSLATQNLMLEAWARGLGTCFSAWWPTAPEKVVIPVKEILKIPEKYVIITMTPLGYPIDPPEEAFHLPPSRKPLEKIISYETFSS
ncbi:MAG: nitroreductase family protein [Candidatus Helarchaeota archaeon]|nr:nitroreductase family protein [Candidatus Helarchaeota archaeon]